MAVKVRAVEGNPTPESVETHEVVETVKQDGITVKQLETDPIKDNLVSQEMLVAQRFEGTQGDGKIRMPFKPKKKETPKDPPIETPIETLSQEEVKESDQKAVEKLQAEAQAIIDAAKKKVEELSSLSDADKLTELIKLRNPDMDKSDIDFILDDEYTIREDHEWIAMGEDDPDKNQKNSIRFKKDLAEYNNMLEQYVKSETQKANDMLKPVEKQAPKATEKPVEDVSEPQQEETTSGSESVPKAESDEIKAMRAELDMLKKEMRGEMKYEVKAEKSDGYEFKLGKANAKKRSASDDWKVAQEQSSKHDDPWKDRRSGKGSQWKVGDRIASIKTEDGDVKLS